MADFVTPAKQASISPFQMDSCLRRNDEYSAKTAEADRYYETESFLELKGWWSVEGPVVELSVELIMLRQIVVDHMPGRPGSDENVRCWCEARCIDQRAVCHMCFGTMVQH
jgi:hypothetical protein